MHHPHGAHELNAEGVYLARLFMLIRAGDRTFRCTVARTPEAHARGLQGASLAADEALLFDFSGVSASKIGGVVDAPRTFHMGTVDFPIDIAWYNSAGRRTRLVTAEPGTRTRWTAPAAFVLEARAGALTSAFTLELPDERTAATIVPDHAALERAIYGARGQNRLLRRTIDILREIGQGRAARIASAKSLVDKYDEDELSDEIVTAIEKAEALAEDADDRDGHDAAMKAYDHAADLCERAKHKALADELKGQAHDQWVAKKESKKPKKKKGAAEQLPFGEVREGDLKQAVDDLEIHFDSERTFDPKDFELVGVRYIPVRDLPDDVSAWLESDRGSVQLPADENWDAFRSEMEGQVSSRSYEHTVEQLREGTLAPAIILEVDGDQFFMDGRGRANIAHALDTPLPCAIFRYRGRTAMEREAQAQRDIVVTIPKAKAAEIEAEERDAEERAARGEQLTYYWAMGRLPKEQPRRVYFVWDGAVRAYHDCIGMDRTQGRLLLDLKIHDVTPEPSPSFRGFRYYEVPSIAAPMRRATLGLSAAYEIQEPMVFLRTLIDGLVAVAVRGLAIHWRPDTLNNGVTESAVVDRRTLMSWLEAAGAADVKGATDAAMRPEGLELIGDALVAAGVAPVARQTPHGLVLQRRAV